MTYRSNFSTFSESVKPLTEEYRVTGMLALVFYDTETTETNTTFDQILQFAAIKTDDDLNELDGFDIRCRQTNQRDGFSN